MNIDVVNKWLSAGASIAVIIGVVTAIVAAIVATNTLKHLIRSRRRIWC
jgi:hypothetical protein